MKVITFSLNFPNTHPRKGEPTFFVEKIWKGIWDGETSMNNPLAGYWEQYDQAFPLKYTDQENIHQHKPKVHTIRAGNRWKVDEWFSPRIWTGKPYASKQLQFGPPIQIKKIFKIKVDDSGLWVDDYLWQSPYDRIAINDGLNNRDFIDWIIKPYSDKKSLIGQAICWDESIEY